MSIDGVLNTLDLSKYPVDEINELITRLYPLGLLSCPISIGSTIQRISPYINDSVQMLSYNQDPPKYGRANIPHVPMFYGCLDIPNDNKTTNEMIVAILEGRALNNGISIFSTWRVEKTLRVGCIIHPSIFPGSNNKFLIRLKLRYSLLVKKYRNSQIDKVWKQVCAQFSKRNPTKKDYNYLFTALLTRRLLEEGPYDGILYPSVQTEGNVCMNIALTKEAVDNKVSFVKAQKSLIYKEDVDTYRSTPLQIGVSNDGKSIVWSESTL